jgi:glycosyltransferase involved in cell wall biosynthesis
MNHKTIVTIGLCVKNVETTIKGTIRSILNQSFPHNNMEIIIVDGNSKDKTISIIKKELAQKPIRYHIFFENEGLAKARNIVINNASGKYIVWIDGDMIVEKDFVKKQVDFMEKNPNVAIAGGRFIMLDETNFIAALECIDWIVGDYRCGQIFSSEPVRNCCAGSIHRVDVVKKVGGFDEKIKGAEEDVDLGYRVGRAGWFLFFTTDALFYDKRRDDLISLWRENFWYGYGGHYVIHKHKMKLSVSAFTSSVHRALTAYKITRRKVAFLLPLLYFFKKIAWFFGYVQAHVHGYGHKVDSQ